MTEPIIRVTDIAFPRFQAPDLDRMEAVPDRVRHARAARTDQALYMRGTDRRPPCARHPPGRARLPRPGLPGRRATTSIPWRAATGGRVEALDEPGGGSSRPPARSRRPRRRCRPRYRRARPPADPDPSTGQHRREPRPRRHAPARCRRAVAGQALRPRGDQDGEPEGPLAWYRRHLGMVISDDMYVEGPDRPLGRFARCDRGGAPADHHTLLLLEMGEAKLGHVAWEVADFDDLMVGHDRLAPPGRGTTGASAGTFSAARSSTTGRTPSASPSSTGPTAICSTPPCRRAPTICSKRAAISGGRRRRRTWTSEPPARGGYERWT
jgi:hypothetical protein